MDWWPWEQATFEEAKRRSVPSACHWWGGIYDQLGGGFARYSVDREWIVPHFEKVNV